MRVLSVLTVTFLMLWAPLSAHGQEEKNTYSLSYRGHNVWVHVDDMAPLNKLSELAKKKQIQDFVFYLPHETKKDSLYIERLTVIRDILIKRLGTDDITLTQEGTQPKANTIIISPN